MGTVPATETKSDLTRVYEFLNEVGLLARIENDSAQMLAWHDMPGSLWEVAGPLGHATYCALVVNEEGQRGLTYLSIETLVKPGWHAFLIAAAGPRGEVRAGGLTKCYRSLVQWYSLQSECLKAAGSRCIAEWDSADVRIEPDAREEWFRA